MAVQGSARGAVKIENQQEREALSDGEYEDLHVTFAKKCQVHAFRTRLRSDDFERVQGACKAYVDALQERTKGHEKFSSADEAKRFSTYQACEQGRDSPLVAQSLAYLRAIAIHDISEEELEQIHQEILVLPPIERKLEIDVRLRALFEKYSLIFLKRH